MCIHDCVENWVCVDVCVHVCLCVLSCFDVYSSNYSFYSVTVCALIAPVPSWTKEEDDTIAICFTTQCCYTATYNYRNGSRQSASASHEFQMSHGCRCLLLGSWWLSGGVQCGRSLVRIPL